ncbi:MAG: hypothetical protein ACOCWQ_06380, partial [Nanoarchaeota archaeon]
MPSLEETLRRLSSHGLRVDPDIALQLSKLQTLYDLANLKKEERTKSQVHARSSSRSDMARRLIELSILSGVLPQGEQLIRSSNDFYVSADVVGQQQVLENARIYVDTTLQWKTLYDVKTDSGLKRALNADSKNRRNIAKRLVETGILSGVLPQGEQLVRGTNNSYTSADVVGQQQVLQNAKIYVDTTLQWKTLYDVKKDSGLKKALNADSINRHDLAKRLVETGILSGVLP